MNNAPDTLGARLGWWLLKAVTLALYIFLFAPIAVIVALSFNSATFSGFPIQGFSLQWYSRLLDNEAIMGALWTSVTLGASTAVLTTLVGFMAAVALAREKVKGGKIVGASMILPILVPETVLAVGLLILLKFIDGSRSFLLLLAGHVLLAMPFAVLVLQARLSALSRSYEDAASSLGAAPLSVLWQITIPLCLPALLASFMFSFALSFDNLTATLFWIPAGMQTLPTQILAMLRDSISPEINALATVMMVLTVALAFAGVIVSRRGARQSGN